MSQRIHLRPYGQRWQVQTVFSMIKRNQGAVVAARSYHARNREMRLAVLTHNIGFLLARWLFCRALLTPLFAVDMMHLFKVFVAKQIPITPKRWCPAPLHPEIVVVFINGMI